MNSIKEFLELIEYEVDQIIDFFNYGHEIKIDVNMGLQNDRTERLRKLWIKTYDSFFGRCFTFDPVRNNISLQQTSLISFQFKVRY